PWYPCCSRPPFRVAALWVQSRAQTRRFAPLEATPAGPMMDADERTWLRDRSNSGRAALKRLFRRQAEGQARPAPSLPPKPPNRRRTEVFAGGDPRLAPRRTRSARALKAQGALRKPIPLSTVHHRNKRTEGFPKRRPNAGHP